ncbi:hypothetical protein RFI_11363 [Reticulomyxa filosa]|uniref:Uncharacterized protein n=1 Tax=Reticulomyxa filosa TaxID=46433 RepID=X6NIP3_RETFI|nr:hypothetical protein RFI_11363 [Reticulomyxa filosa]|eukprot:ETO25773.1 hypothetical protein RFI_11363 [Reticulomyxa filosa]
MSLVFSRLDAKAAVETKSQESRLRRLKDLRHQHQTLWKQKHQQRVEEEAQVKMDLKNELIKKWKEEKEFKLRNLTRAWCAVSFGAGHTDAEQETKTLLVESRQDAAALRFQQQQTISRAQKAFCDMQLSTTNQKKKKKKEKLTHNTIKICKNTKKIKQVQTLKNTEPKKNRQYWVERSEKICNNQNVKQHIFGRGDVQSSRQKMWACHVQSQHAFQTLCPKINKTFEKEIFAPFSVRQNNISKKLKNNFDTSSAIQKYFEHMFESELERNPPMYNEETPRQIIPIPVDDKFVLFFYYLLMYLKFNFTIINKSLKI